MSETVYNEDGYLLDGEVPRIPNVNPLIRFQYRLAPQSFVYQYQRLTQYRLSAEDVTRSLVEIVQAGLHGIQVLEGDGKTWTEIPVGRDQLTILKGHVLDRIAQHACGLLNPVVRESLGKSPTESGSPS